jgi:hypothetical protein
MTADEFTKLPLTTIPFRPLRPSPISCPTEARSNTTVQTGVTTFSRSASATICAIKKSLAYRPLWSAFVWLCLEGSFNTLYGTVKTLWD